MKNLIVIAHPNKSSFCYNGIYKTILTTLKECEDLQFIETIDLYEDEFQVLNNKKDVDIYKKLVEWAERIYFISPVWWFRTTPLLEAFFDAVFVPGFAYKFTPITKTYGYPTPLLSHKKVRTYLTHGAPALPVMTIYLNSVKLRLVMGVYSFVFGWFKTKTRQFWSVPFISEEKRKKYLMDVKNDIIKDLSKK